VPSLSVSIMAHPSRKEWVQELWNTIGPVPTAWDQIGSEWDTGTRAWALADPGSSWHLVLQDDTLVTPDLVPRATRILEALDHRGPVSLYLGTGRPQQRRVLDAIARAKDGIVTLPWLIWGPAIVLPTKDIGPVLDYASRLSYPYDKRLAAYYKLRRIPCLYPHPSLVDHRDTHSLLGHDMPGMARHAHAWIGNEEAS